MSEKKRKREGDDVGPRSEKRIATGQTQVDSVKVSLIPEENEWAPVVGMTISNIPGLSWPPNVPLKPYKKSRKNHASITGKTPLSASEHLLHTCAHPKIDYIAREEEGAAPNGSLNHYLGVYDPKSGQLQLVRARKLVLRSTVRPVPPSRGESLKRDNVSRRPVPINPLFPSRQATLNQIQGLSARNELGLTFGTKKSQRAIESLTKNAISPSKPRSLPGQPTRSTIDPTASAVLSSMSSSAPTREELQASVDESKPRPRPNLSADTPADVYPLEQLLGQGTLRQMTVKEWQDAIEAGEEILTKSRFVSHRVQAIVKSGDVRRLKTLKYLLLLLEWYNALQPARGKGGAGRQVPPPEKLQRELTGWSSLLVESVAQRFAEEGGRTLTRWHLDNLITHVCALAVTID
ncbi:MAG: hypothetical protein L6R39_005638, partial [Caloplaca ligustica]